ncbi:hypothetical protein [Marinisporobacter balticus]|uniref:hypothetical protein n=1 Tax=Marinisporobacter balticus TaxID=2018667 RepID=UPI001051B83A|nr:hypothetical protein [Marinisporobacter balticus]
MENNKVICFSCITPLHVFVSYILSKTIYINNYKIIIFSDYHLKSIYQNAKKFKIWNELILIEEKDLPFSQIQPQFNKIDFKNIDVLHYFSWGSPFNTGLMHYTSNKTKIILTDEGGMTYIIKEAYNHWRSKFKLQSNAIDFNKISEIWLFDKRLYISELNKPLKDIAFKKYLDSDLKYEICSELNTLFDYNRETIDWDILFFDQYLSYADLSYIEEKHLLMSIIKASQPFKLLIKKHPLDDYKKYNNLNVNILKNNNVPWEVIFLNEYIHDKMKVQNKTYMTYGSSALFNTCILFKDFDIDNHFIILNKLLINSSKNGFGTNNEKNKFYNTFKELYGINLYEVESLIELKNILKKLF